MGGIAGIVHFNKQLASPNILRLMSSALSHRGSEGIAYHTTNHVGLCQLTSHSPPVSQGNPPTPSFSDKKQFIVFHGRLDNREYLYHYSDPKRPLKETTDSQLVMAAYRRLDTRCTDKLLGDFAFAIWDSDKQTLFCGRDHMGVKPFFYINTGSFFAFASEIKGILALPDIPKVINRNKIADFLVCLTTEHNTTFYKHIFRLPPAHYLSLKDSVMQINKYWSLKPAKLQCKNSQEYQEAFFEIFQEAVHTRLRSTSAVGAYLSGGIDSASIVSMAAGHLNNTFPGKLNTFTGIFDHIPECDERESFQPILDRYPVQPHYIHADKLHPSESFDATMDVEDEPFFSPHFFMSWHLQQEMKEKGIKVLLDGHDGDSAVSYGHGLLPQLAMQGKLIRLYHEQMSFQTATRKQSVRNILCLYRDILTNKLPFLKYQSPTHDQFLRTIKTFTTGFREETDIENRMLDFEKGLPIHCQPEQIQHQRKMSQPFHQVALEFLERTASHFDIEQRFPFFDIRLISFCLALPAEQKLENGYNRAIVRKSLRSILPKTIRQRKLKTNFTRNLLDAFLERDKNWFARTIDHHSSEIFTILRKNEIQKNYDACFKNETIPLEPLCNTLRYIALSKWLKKA